MTTDTLPGLLSTLGSSLPMYVADAGIWSYPGAEEIKLALADLVGDQRSIMERAGTIVEERGEVVPRHAYPIQFTATHDLDLQALLPRIVEGAHGQAERLDAILAAGGEPADLDLIREAKSTTLRHADILAQLAARPRAVAS